jgi:hypothetical protein
MKYVTAGVMFTDLVESASASAHVRYGMPGRPRVLVGLAVERITDVDVTMTPAQANAYMEALHTAAKAQSVSHGCDSAQAVTIPCKQEEVDASTEARATVRCSGSSVTVEIAYEGYWGRSLAVTMGREEAAALAGLLRAAVEWVSQHRPPE